MLILAIRMAATWFGVFGISVAERYCAHACLRGPSGPPYLSTAPGAEVIASRPDKALLVCRLSIYFHSS